MQKPGLTGTQAPSALISISLQRLKSCLAVGSIDLDPIIFTDRTGIKP
jgi:hypothetical protein